jgi:hypothetical protein
MSFDFNLPSRDWPEANHHHDADLARIDWPAEEAAEELSDDWLDEALRKVPLPSGFLDRMSVLAEPIFTDHFDVDRRFSPG